MSRLFGTDGVRGIANSELTPMLAFKLGQAGAYILTGESSEAKHKTKIMIAKDTRISGDMLEAALVAGICSVGAEAIIVGVIPTPACAYLTRLHNCDAGIMISASHNTMEYNGIKFFDRNGFKLKDEIEDEIERLMEEGNAFKPPIGADIGTVTYKYDMVDDYIAFAKSTIPFDLKGMKIAIDCANGAASFTSRQVLEGLGATVFVIHDTPDGININDN